MFDLISRSWQDVLLVSFGAIQGAYLRFYFLKKIRLILSKKYWGTIILNTLSSFCLGLVLACESKEILPFKSTRFILFFCTGFLGSLSTFSTYIVEIFQVFRNYRWMEGFVFSVVSLVGGLFASIAGYLIIYDK